jgi:plasmid stability protein
MASLTIRNIPEETLSKIRKLSALERRSVNSEMLVIIERGASMEMTERAKTRRPVPKDLQVRMWRSLSHEWQDTRSTQEVIDAIYAARTVGRDFRL